MTSAKILYFAYCSNICEQRLFERIGYVKEIGKKRLFDYRLRFNVGLSKSRCFANIEYAKGSSVTGILYEISAEQLDILDKYEGFYNKKFFVDDGTVIITYVGNKYFLRKKDGNITDEYRQVIKNACLRKGILTTLKSLI